MPFQQGAVLNTQSFGNRPETVEVPHTDVRDPTTLDTGKGFFPVGKVWINTVAGNVFQLVNFSSAGGSVTANWVALGGATTAIATINNTAPIAGNFTLAGTANQITVTTTAGTATFSLPVAITAPGSLTTTTSLSATTTVTGGTGVTATTGNVTATAGAVSAGTTVTGGTGVTATTGNITATAGAVSAGTTVTGGTGVIATTGNLTASAVASGLLLTPTIVSGASAQTANGRVGQVTFTGVSIAAGATQSFVINNTSIAAIATVISYSMVGATAGAALSIVSVTNVAATSSTIVVTNGTGATTSTADITFTFLVLN